MLKYELCLKYCVNLQTPYDDLCLKTSRREKEAAKKLQQPEKSMQPFTILKLYMTVYKMFLFV